MSINYKIPAGGELRIAVSGKSGCGNTTVSKLLADSLGIKMINFTFRQLAQEQGLTLAQVIERAKSDDSFDITVDTRQVELARQDSCVLGSRLAVWMLKEADFKVYLYADEMVRAARILNREGGSLEEIAAFTAMRDAQDSSRYLRLYNIDNNDYDFCDMIIDTARHTPEDICANILAKLAGRGLVVPLSGADALND